MKRTALLLFIFLCSITSPAQLPKDSCTMEISLLTCAPGADLYSIFGHTAIRVQDLRRGMDIIYNYGTFDDTDPLFYIHFMRGIMRYSLSAETFTEFMQEYEYEQRGIKAQILNLTCAEKNKLYESLRNNTLEENRFYDYHFHTDNCTTRAGRIIESNTGDSSSYKNILPYPGPSFRDMIHEYLNIQHQYWSAFGIDMFLGRNLDQKAANTEAIHFLPDYLYRGMDSALAGNKPLVLGKKTLLSFPDSKTNAGILTPMIVFNAMFLLVLGLYFFKNKRGSGKALLIFDIVFFSLLGLIGILMTAMWLGRVDDVCSNNMNILWAIPTHVAVGFLLYNKAGWTKYYFLLTTILAVVLLFGYPWWTQRMNAAVLPVLGIIIFRSYMLYQNRNYAEKSVIPG